MRANELFGHVKGASPAGSGGGTLFLDEITEMSPTMQVTLLLAIQEKEVLPLGATPTVKGRARNYIAWVVQEVGGNQTLAAQMLGIDRGIWLMRVRL